MITPAEPRSWAAGDEDSRGCAPPPCRLPRVRQAPPPPRVTAPRRFGAAGASRPAAAGSLGGDFQFHVDSSGDLDPFMPSNQAARIPNPIAGCIPCLSSPIPVPAGNSTLRIARGRGQPIMRVGAVGSRWVPWSSKPVVRRQARHGGFDSHALPPPFSVSAPWRGLVGPVIARIEGCAPPLPVSMLRQQRVRVGLAARRSSPTASRVALVSSEGPP